MKFNQETFLNKHFSILVHIDRKYNMVQLVSTYSEWEKKKKKKGMKDLNNLHRPVVRYLISDGHKSKVSM